MKVFSVVNNKGGVGKTTIAVNLGHALALKGKSVLLIDSDVQDNLRIWFNIAKSKISLFDVLIRDQNINQALIKVRDNLWICPSGGEDLGAVPYLLKDRKNPAFKLKLALETVAIKFDYCLIDCSPSRTLLHTVAVVASDYIIIPVNMEWLAAVGTAQVDQSIRDVSDKYKLGTKIGLIVPTFVDRRRPKITEEVILSLQAKYQGKVSQVPIRINSKLSEAPGYSQTIFEMRDPRGMDDFKRLAEEVEKIA